MLKVKSRVTELIQRLESGDVPTSAELRNIANLQALDLAKLGEDFVNEQGLREEEATENFKQILG